MGLLKQTETDYYKHKENYGEYQFVSLNDIINQFMIGYVGADKLISKANKSDVQFYAMRALQELSFDTFKSTKSQEFVLPPSLTIPVPQDYVNYVKLTWSDSDGIERTIYPASKTSNPKNPYQNSNKDFKFTVLATFTSGNPTITLDKEYPNIFPGMIIRSPHIPTDRNIITSVTTDGSNTSVSLSDANEIPINIQYLPDFSDDVTVEILNPDGSLFYEAKTTSYVANNIDVPTTGSYYLTVSTTDAENINVGMRVCTQQMAYDSVQTHLQNYAYDVYNIIPPNAYVEAIDGTKVTISKAIGHTGNFTSIDVMFISQDFESDTWGNYKSSSNSSDNNVDTFDSKDTDIYDYNKGQRYGVDPQHSQVNGSFYIDENTGKIHFSSNFNGKSVVLKYISDSLGTNDEMKVHKLAEEAMYKWIAYSIISTKANMPEYIVNRFRKDKFAATRQAKLRLSNIKIEEITQILRGKSKWIKH